jgi:hypothetical protein
MDMPNKHMHVPQVRTQFEVINMDDETAEIELVSTLYDVYIHNGWNSQRSRTGVTGDDRGVHPVSKWRGGLDAAMSLYRRRSGLGDEAGACDGALSPARLRRL